MAPFDLIETYESEDIIAPAHRSLNHSRIINRVSVAFSRYEDEYESFPELELELTTGKCKPDIAVYKNLPVDWFNDVLYFTRLLSLPLKYSRRNKA